LLRALVEDGPVDAQAGHREVVRGEEERTEIGSCVDAAVGIEAGELIGSEQLASDVDLHPVDPGLLAGLAGEGPEHLHVAALGVGAPREKNGQSGEAGHRCQRDAHASSPPSCPSDLPAGVLYSNQRTRRPQSRAREPNLLLARSRQVGGRREGGLELFGAES